MFWLAGSGAEQMIVIFELFTFSGLFISVIVGSVRFSSEFILNLFWTFVQKQLPLEFVKIDKTNPKK
jgi:hypothetical protein